MSALRSVGRVAVVGFAICTATAMRLYPGGDSFGGRESGFSQARNYFCDLAAPVAHDGSPNGGMRWAQAGVASLACALVCFWLGKRDAERAEGRWARRLGLIGAVGAFALPCGRPSIAGVDLHAAIALGAGVPSIAAAALSFTSASRARRTREAVLGAAALVTSAVTALLYVVFLVGGAPPVALPIAQKIAAACVCAWLLGA